MYLIFRVINEWIKSKNIDGIRILISMPNSETTLKKHDSKQKNNKTSIQKFEIPLLKPVRCIAFL